MNAKHPKEKEHAEKQRFGRLAPFFCSRCLVISQFLIYGLMLMAIVYVAYCLQSYTHHALKLDNAHTQHKPHRTRIPTAHSKPYHSNVWNHRLRHRPFWKRQYVQFKKSQNIPNQELFRRRENRMKFSFGTDNRERPTTSKINVNKGTLRSEEYEERCVGDSCEGGQGEIQGDEELRLRGMPTMLKEQEGADGTRRLRQENGGGDIQGRQSYETGLWKQRGGDVTGHIRPDNDANVDDDDDDNDDDDWKQMHMYRGRKNTAPVYKHLFPIEKKTKDGKSMDRRAKSHTNNLKSHLMKRLKSKSNKASHRSDVKHGRKGTAPVKKERKTGRFHKTRRIRNHVEMAQDRVDTKLVGGGFNEHNEKQSQTEENNRLHSQSGLYREIDEIGRDKIEDKVLKLSTEDNVAAMNGETGKRNTGQHSNHNKQSTSFVQHKKADILDVASLRQLDFPVSKMKMSHETAKEYPLDVHGAHDVKSPSTHKSKTFTHDQISLTHIVHSHSHIPSSKYVNLRTSLRKSEQMDSSLDKHQGSTMFRTNMDIPLQTNKPHTPRRNTLLQSNKPGILRKKEDTTVQIDNDYNDRRTKDPLLQIKKSLHGRRKGDTVLQSNKQRILRRKEGTPLQTNKPRILRRKEDIPLQTKKPHVFRRKENTPLQTNKPRIPRRKENTPLQTKKPRILRRKEDTPLQTKKPHVFRRKENTPLQTNKPRMPRRKENTPLQKNKPHIFRREEDTPLQTNKPHILRSKGDISSQTNKAHILGRKENAPLQTNKHILRRKGDVPVHTNKPHILRIKQNAPLLTKKPRIIKGTEDMYLQSSKPGLIKRKLGMALQNTLPSILQQKEDNPLLDGGRGVLASRRHLQPASYINKPATIKRKVDVISLNKRLDNFVRKLDTPFKMIKSGRLGIKDDLPELNNKQTEQGDNEDKPRISHLELKGVPILKGLTGLQRINSK